MSTFPSSDKRNAVNELHITKPQVGDYWQEMFCPYFVVLGKAAGKIIICDKTKSAGTNRWTWDLTDLKLESLDSLRKRVSYSSIPGFVADVVPRAHKVFAQQLKDESVSLKPVNS